MSWCFHGLALGSADLGGRGGLHQQPDRVRKEPQRASGPGEVFGHSLVGTGE